jgi:hypothetical protein
VLERAGASAAGAFERGARNKRNNVFAKKGGVGVGKECRYVKKPHFSQKLREHMDKHGVGDGIIGDNRNNFGEEGIRNRAKGINRHNLAVLRQIIFLESWARCEGGEKSAGAGSAVRRVKSFKRVSSNTGKARAKAPALLSIED